MLAHPFAIGAASAGKLLLACFLSFMLRRTGKGVMWHGTWEIKGNTNCSNWKEAPNAPCSKYEKQGDNVTIINTATGQVRAKIVKTAPGNAEKLAP